MNHLPITIFFITWLARAVLFAGGVYAANASMVQAAAEELRTSAATLDLHYDNSLVNADINNAPLGKVLRELALKSGMEINLSDPLIARGPVSVSIRAIPLEEAVQQILEGFSYALYRVSNRLVVIILSTQPNAIKTGLKTAVIGVKRALLQPMPDKATSQDFNLATSTHSCSERAPQSLDEFQPITIEDVSSHPEAQGDRNAARSGRLAQEQQYKEALLRRALDALGFEHKHLHIEAINQLAGLEDPRASEALVEVATNSAGLDAQYRLEAVGTLWRHAQDLHYADVTSVNALKRLAEDSDKNVRRLARQALRDMEQ